MLLTKAYYTFKFLVPRRLQIWCRRYYVNRKRPLHADTWPIDPNATHPLEHAGKTGLREKGKTGATPYFSRRNRELYRLFPRRVQIHENPTQLSWAKLSLYAQIKDDLI